MSCPMTRTAVTSVCQLRDKVSHRNLIIAQEWRKGEEQCLPRALRSPTGKLPCSAAQRLSAGYRQDREAQESKCDPVRSTGHSLWKWFHS